MKNLMKKICTVENGLIAGVAIVAATGVVLLVKTTDGMRLGTKQEIKKALESDEGLNADVLSDPPEIASFDDVDVQPLWQESFESEVKSTRYGELIEGWPDGKVKK